MQIRAENATHKGYTKQVFGTMQVVGNVVRFYPRLPTQLRDPKTGDFYPLGSVQDDAARNAGLQPSTNYQVLAIGRPALSPIDRKSTRLNSSHVSESRMPSSA